MAMGIFTHLHAGEALPEGLGNPKDAIEIFQRRSTECLIISKYSTTPGPHTIEALLVNLQSEFVRMRDVHLGIWVMGGVA